MKTDRKTLSIAILALLTFGALPVKTTAAPLYTNGAILSDFTLYARHAWTNAAGRRFTPGDPVRLSDFDGHVAFIKFFDAT